MPFKATNLLGLAKAIRALAKVPSRVTTAFAGWITEESQRNYSSARNPYGGAWKPLLPQTVIRKDGDARILQRGNVMKPSVKAVPRGGAGIDLIVDPFYATYHHTGTGRNLEARPIFPNAGMPATWTAELKRITAEEMEK